MARSSCFSFDSMYRSEADVSDDIQNLFENTHWSATCVVVAASSNSVFKHVRDRGMFFFFF